VLINKETKPTCYEDSTTSYVSRTRRFTQSAGVNPKSIARLEVIEQPPLCNGYYSLLNHTPTNHANHRVFKGEQLDKWPSRSSNCDTRKQSNFPTQTGSIRLRLCANFSRKQASKQYLSPRKGLRLASLRSAHGRHSK